MMKRRDFLRKAPVAGLGATTAALASPAIAQSNPEIKWRLTASWTRALDTLYGGAEHISKRVAALTDNKFKLTVFAAGEIVPGLQVLDAVQAGNVECGHTGLTYYYGKDDTFIFGSALPFGMTSRMQNAWYLQAGGNDMLTEFLKAYNVIHFPAGNTHCQMGGWFRKEIKTLDDLKGLKFRIAGFAGRIMQKRGVVPQQIAAGEIYQALEKGAIDGAEWIGPYDDEKLGFFKIAKFYHYPGWWETNSTTNFIINLDKWNELPKQYQEALQSAVLETNQWIATKYDAVNPPALRSLIAQGTQLTPFSTEVMDACYASAQELYKEISDTNPRFKKIYDHQKEFWSNGYLWHQVADYTMESYSIRYFQQSQK